MMVMEQFGKREDSRQAKPIRKIGIFQFPLHQLLEIFCYLKYFVGTNGIFVTIAARSFPRT